MIQAGLDQIFADLPSLIAFAGDHFDGSVTARGAA